MICNTNKPELLAPAGSREALKAAVSAGCDAVYLGMKEFSARAFAENFEDNEIQKDIDYCHLFGVKVYVAINNQIYEKELPSAVNQVLSLYEKGADGFIVSNIGLASYIHRNYPDIILHASTQATGVNSKSATFFEKNGFSRMVVPREISFNDLKLLSDSSNIELELFIHGALCVSVSGQCLMSSIIGGRSGNRGECAQPCRMEYENGKYPLSLKDMNLALCMTDLLKLNISSFKIEGRMKSLEYVYSVTRIYRKLIDECRNATPEEIKELNTIFSRSGSTNGYFTNKIDHSMLGIRKQQDKTNTEQYEKNVIIEDKKVPLELKCELIKNEKSHIKGTIIVDNNCITKDYFGSVCETSNSCSITKESLFKQLSKLGNTNFILKNNSIDIHINENVFLPISALNMLRRGIIEELENAIKTSKKVEYKNVSVEHTYSSFKDQKIAIFVDYKTITKEAIKYFDRIYVNVFDYSNAVQLFNVEKIGIIYPPVYLDSEIKNIENYISKAAKLGCKYAIVSNSSQIENAKDNNFDTILSYRFNVYNSFDVDAYHYNGIDNYICSNELNLKQMNYLSCYGDKYSIVYGKIPLMLLHKCVIKEIKNLNSNDCKYCNNGKFENLVDSTKTTFKLYGCGNRYRHRNILFNSVPVWMADKYDSVKKASLNGLFMFTDETSKEVDLIIDAYRNESECKSGFRRIKND